MNTSTGIMLQLQCWCLLQVEVAMAGRCVRAQSLKTSRFASLSPFVTLCDGVIWNCTLPFVLHRRGVRPHGHAGVGLNWNARVVLAPGGELQRLAGSGKVQSQAQGHRAASS